MDKNINQGFCGAGMVFKSIGMLADVILSFGSMDMDWETYSTLSVISLMSMIGTDAMWMTSAINGAGYTRKVAQAMRHASISFHPIYLYSTESAGAVMRLSY